MKNERWRVSGRTRRATNFPLLGKFSLQLGAGIARNLTFMLLALVIHMILALDLAEKTADEKEMHCQEENMRRVGWIEKKIMKECFSTPLHI